VIAAIFLLDVADHLAAAGFAEIDVEIGHRHAFGVEEALEQQPQLERIEIGDRQHPGDHRARARAAARTDRDVVRLCPLDEVGDDQEIAREAHLDDDVELELEPVLIGLALLGRGDAGLGETGVEPDPGELAQHRRLAVAVAGEAGQDRLALGRGEGAALGDDHRVGDALGQIGEQRLHLAGGLHPRASGELLRAIVAGDIGRAGDAQHRVVRLVEALVGEAARVGRDLAEGRRA
jgi:hypothetical protein